MPTVHLFLLRTIIPVSSQPLSPRPPKTCPPIPKSLSSQLPLILVIPLSYTHNLLPRYLVRTSPHPTISTSARNLFKISLITPQNHVLLPSSVPPPISQPQQGQKEFRRYVPISSVTNTLHTTRNVYVKCTCKNSYARYKAHLLYTSAFQNDDQPDRTGLTRTKPL